LSSIRDHFFYHLDRLLPRKVAVFPYVYALKSLQQALLAFPDFQIWDRNSIRKGNFVFGVSDLDLTLLIGPGAKAEDLVLVLKMLIEHKLLYPFIGETNFFRLDVLPIFINSFNHFERLRDPSLDPYLFPAKNKNDLGIEKIAFLLRMIFSDHVKLAKSPGLRQRKWQNHLFDLGLKSERFINWSKLIEVISESSQIDIEVVRETLLPLQSQDLTDEKIFSSEMSKYWKYFYPNKHLWFHEGSEQDLEENEDSIFGKICLKQIEWEMWGLMSQYPYLKKDVVGLSEHVSRLVKVAEKLNTKKDISIQAEELLKLVRNL
jgi:hypothetical protein